MQRIAGELLDAEQRLASSLKGEVSVTKLTTISAAVTPFQVARQFLTSMAFLQRQHATSPLPLRVLPRRAAVWRDLSLLDQLSPRQTVQVSCLYVGNDNGEEESAAYRSLLHSLAWQQSADVWRWESPLAEMLFLPKNESSSNIQLVWSEHWQDYEPNTKDETVQVAIILYPVERWPSAVRVHIWTRPSLALPPFGPLHHGCLVARAELACLLNPTLLSAHQALQQTQLNPFMTPWEQRHAALSQLIERWALSSWSMEQVLQYAMFANQPLPDELLMVAEPEMIKATDTMQLAEMKAELEEISKTSEETPEAVQAELQIADVQSELQSAKNDVLEEEEAAKVKQE